MVRAIVGTQLDVLKGRYQINDLENIIDSGSRKNAGTSAAAHGLYLSEVTYKFI